MTRRPFVNHLNHTLVETGSYRGDGIQAALDAGFQKIISFEIVPALYDHCVQRFNGNSKVELILGSSVELLYPTIKDVSDSITFWLDGHYSCGVTGHDPDYMCPIIPELEQIKRHGSNHTILIDDRRLFRIVPNSRIEEYFNITEHTVRSKLYEINPKYEISYENGYIENDVIVAKLPACSSTQHCPQSVAFSI